MVEQSETAAVNHFRRGGARRIFLLLLLLFQPLLVGIILLVKASRRSRMGRPPGLRDGGDGSLRLLAGRARWNVGVKVARRSGRDVRLALRIHVNSSAAAVADRHVGARFRLRFVIEIKRQRFISGRGGVVSLFVIVVEGNGGRRRIAGRFAIVLTNVLILPGDDRYIPSCDKKKRYPPPNTQTNTKEKTMAFDPALESPPASRINEF